MQNGVFLNLCQVHSLNQSPGPNALLGIPLHLFPSAYPLWDEARVLLCLKSPSQLGACLLLDCSWVHFLTGLWYAFSFSSISPGFSNLVYFFFPQHMAFYISETPLFFSSFWLFLGPLLLITDRVISTIIWLLRIPWIAMLDRHINICSDFMYA